MPASPIKVCSRSNPFKSWSASKKYSEPAPVTPEWRVLRELKNLAVVKLDYTSVDDNGLESLRVLSPA